MKRAANRTRVPAGFGLPVLFARALFLIGVLATALAGAQGSESSPPPDYQPPAAHDLCGALTLDYELCSDDLASGNCASFVGAADRLGAIYRSELHAHPGWIDELRTTVWWGCGDANLEDLRALLERIDSPQARAALAREPYRSLPAPRAPVARPASPQAPEEPDCMAMATQQERDACASKMLAAAKAAHARAFAACKERVGPVFRATLEGTEQSFENLLSLQCAGDDTTRDECLAHAYEERTRTMLATHRECDAPGAR